MKKLLGIVVLGLLLSGNAYSHEENIDSIENCADRKTRSKLSRYTGYSKKDAGIIFRDMGIQNKEADLILQEASDIIFSISDLSIEANNFIKKNLKNSSYNKPKDKLTIDDLKVPDQEIINKYKKMRKYIEARWGRSDVLLIKGFAKYFSKGIKPDVIKNTDLKLKAKSSYYLEIFTECELEYNKTPNSFLLKYKK
jgi:hypothetical protein